MGVFERGFDIVAADTAEPVLPWIGAQERILLFPARGKEERQDARIAQMLERELFRFIEGVGKICGNPRIFSTMSCRMISVCMIGNIWVFL